MKKNLKTENQAKPEKEPKFSYEDLERIAYQLRADNNYLNERCNQAESVIAEFNEIGMLLSLLERSEHFDVSFVQRCASRIQRLVSEAMDIAEQREAEEKARKEAAEKSNKEAAN